MDTTTNQAATPNPAELAYNHLMGNVHNAHFFNKVASYGLAPRDEQEARVLLQMGEDCFALHNDQLRKQADSRGMFLTKAASELSQLAGTSVPDRHIQEASQAYLNDANTMTAAMVMADYFNQAQR